LTLLDENESGTKHGSMEADYEEWEKKLLTRLLFSLFRKHKNSGFRTVHYVPVIGTVPLTSVRLTGTEYTKFVNGTPFVPLTRSPVNGRLTGVPLTNSEGRFPLTGLSR